MCSSVNLKSHLAIPFNQSYVRSHLATSFNQNQKHVKSGLIVMGDLPRWKNVKNGLIMMGDLPKWKKWWSHCDGWPTQVEKMMVSLWWVTYPKKDGLIMMGDLPRWKNVTYLAKRLGWRSLDRIRLTNCASWLQGWLEDPSWWQGWSPRFFEILLLAGFISFSSRSRI